MQMNEATNCEETMKRTILLVDDDVSVRDSLKKLLETEGYRVLAARDRAEALEWIGTEEIHLAVMDVNLGEEDGLETFNRIAAKHGSLPTVIVTADFGQHDHTIDAGVEVLIEKPMDVPLFLEIIEQLLSEKRKGRLKRVIAANTNAVTSTAAAGGTLRPGASAFHPSCMP
jgi:CheY-like chemotaxis protein